MKGSRPARRSWRQGICRCLKPWSMTGLYVKQYRDLPIKMKRVVRSSCGSLFLLRHEPEVPLVREWTGFDGSGVERPARRGVCVT